MRTSLCRTQRNAKAPASNAVRRFWRNLNPGSSPVACQFFSSENDDLQISRFLNAVYAQPASILIDVAQSLSEITGRAFIENGFVKMIRDEVAYDINVASINRAQEIG